MDGNYQAPVTVKPEEHTPHLTVGCSALAGLAVSTDVAAAWVTNANGVATGRSTPDFGREVLNLVYSFLGVNALRF